MNFREVFRYELEYRVRSPATWLYAVILFAVGFIALHAQAQDVGLTRANAPVMLAMLSVVSSMFGMLVSAALFGDAAVRDVETGLHPLVFTSPLSRAEYLGGRFAATLVVNAVLLFAIPLGLMAATLMPYLDPAALGPFRTTAFIQPWLLFLLPNVLVAGAVLFTTGVFARQVIPVYLAAIGLILAFLVAMQTLSRLTNPVLVLLGDPLGVGTLMDIAQEWSTAERNTRLIGFPAVVVWGRVLWLTIGALVLWLMHRSFRFAHPDVGGRRGKNVPADAVNMDARTRPVAIPRIEGAHGVRTTIRQTITVARNALTETAGTRWFAGVLFAAMILSMFFALGEVGDTPFDTSTWPVTILVIETILGGPVVPMVFLLIAVYAGELVWKARDSGASDILDAAPVPEGALLLGCLLALIAMIVMIQTSLMTGGMLFQALSGYYHFEPGLYLRVFLGLDLAGLVLLAVLALTTHVIVNHKYIGHLAVLIVFLLPVILEQNGIVRHHLLLYGTDPGWRYSGMNGFGPFVAPFLWFKLYWAAWALLLGVFTALLWVRGRESGTRRRTRVARHRLTRPVMRAACVSLVLIVVLGGFAFYNTNILNEYDRGHSENVSRAAYETRYARFGTTRQPHIERAELRVEIHADPRTVDISGRYILVNRTRTPVDSVHMWMYEPDVEVRSITFDRDAAAALIDRDARYRIYRLARALAPGDSMQILFDLSFRPRGFPNSAVPTAVVADGAILNRSWLPFVGYQPAGELTDARVREQLGLPPGLPVPAPDSAGDRLNRLDRIDADRVQLETIIGTHGDQTAVAPGALLRSWTENGRRYFHYRTAAPVPFSAAIVSAKYAVREDRWNDVALSIYHQPTHTYPLESMVSAMKASLAYYTSQFGAYPDSQLRIVETPRYGGGGASHPHTISFTEDNFFSRVRNGQIDQPFYGTAHEIAHQWWGGQVRGAHVRGHGLLSESLANYSAMMVMENTYGRDVARRVYDFQMDHYLKGRVSQVGEVPLLQVQEQAYIAYRKGAVAMYTLREQLGEERVNASLRRYLEKFRNGPPHPTSLDLYAELQAVTPDSLRSLLTDLFETVTLWDTKTAGATVLPDGSGGYVVRLDVVARKTRTDRDGMKSEAPMDDFIEVGVFARGERGRLGAPLYLQRHRIRSGAQTITVPVSRAPARAGIDPYRRLIEMQRADNVIDALAPASEWQR